MRPALFSLHNKRLAKIWERKSHEAAMLADTCPWAKRNFYIFQQQMVEALKERSHGIRQYLNCRARRAEPAYEAYGSKMLPGAAGPRLDP